VWPVRWVRRKIGGKAEVKGVAGTWKDLTDSVNSMALRHLRAHGLLRGGRCMATELEIHHRD